MPIEPTATLLRSSRSRLRRALGASRTGAVVALLALALQACSAYRACGFEGCAGDAELTAGVQRELARHPALEGTNALGVQTLDRVVYLTGLVDTERERSLAESAAAHVDGIARVVNSIAVRNAPGH